MKLPLEFTGLRSLVHQMGAPPVHWDSTWNPLDPMELKRSLETTGKIVTDLAEVETGPDGRLYYHGHHIVLYIKDARRDKTTLAEPKEGPRYHLADCRTIAGMKAANRFDRYVLTSRQDGKFYVDAYDWSTQEMDEVLVHLLPCKNCLSTLNFAGYNEVANRDQIWLNFDMEQFFREETSEFSQLPTYSDLTAPPSGYSQEWNTISEHYRQKLFWRCEQKGCGLDCSAEEHRSLLHTHHRNGVKSDNRHVNLQALCIEHHVLQPSHAWMLPRFRAQLEKVRRLRQEQRNQHPNTSAQGRRLAPSVATDSEPRPSTHRAVEPLTAPAANVTR